METIAYGATDRTDSVPSKGYIYIGASSFIYSLSLKFAVLIPII